MSNRWKSNSRKDSGVFLRRFKTELIVGFILGAVPLLINSTNQAELQAILQSLLASAPILNHAGCLLTIYVAVCIHKKIHRLKSDRMRDRFEMIYKVTAEVGTSFLTLLRTGLGAIVGFLMIAPFMDEAPISLNHWLSTALYCAMTLVFSASVSLLHDFLMTRPTRSHPKNHIRL
ncbi:hypothetical protein CUN61_10205 [Pseudomonas arsenicoxydans]|uniref:MotA/TolQ/ExbB proton channel domain-containing protein n=1 Tax=Pseudomonas arsenicoxydans TaxID=702115 RepID=A0A4P6G4N2_9PSED|nr:hypothetical protein CUN61_10205 [Pseudomonas arsenicoxydans]